LVRPSNDSDVCCYPGNAAARNPFLANTRNVLRPYLRALSCDNLDARKIRHHDLMQRSKLEMPAAGNFLFELDHSAAKISRAACKVRQRSCFIRARPVL
jgi:hypothetical protein